jgi:hypothetical protein
MKFSLLCKGPFTVVSASANVSLNNTKCLVSIVEKGIKSYLILEGGPETSVRNYNYTLHNNPEKRGSHLRHSGIPKSREQVYCL